MQASSYIDSTVSGIRKAELFLDKKESLRTKEKLLSHNHKTGLSLNFPHVRTCSPTRVCSKKCYAAKRGAHITYDRSLKKYLRNYWYFKTEIPEKIADKIAQEFYSKRERPKFIRWNGVGDLFEESVEVLNSLLTRYSDIHIWVVTRKPKLAVKISATPNVHIMFSLDRSSLNRRSEVGALGGHPRLYYSYLRTSEDEKPKNVRVIFNEKGNRTLTSPTRQYCPADSKLYNTTKNACLICRRCWNFKGEVNGNQRTKKDL